MILNKVKKYEIRKNTPRNITVPFKVYIYCTKSKNSNVLWILDEKTRKFFKKHKIADIISAKSARGGGVFKGNGFVVGEYICDEIVEVPPDNNEYGKYDVSHDELNDYCLTQEELWNYGKGKKLYAYHISDLVVYDKPKEISEFYKYCNDDCSKCQSVRETSRLKRPPQSWCYVEGE